MKALFVVNARAGPRRRRDLHALIREHCRWKEHEIVSCARLEELDALIARAAREAFDAVIAVGGDGTVHEVARRLIGTSLALGIVPAGSGNGFARHIGLPANPRRALIDCAEGRVVAIDTAEVNGVPFIGVMGVGFDATIAEGFAGSTTRGLRTYAGIGARTIRRYRVEEYEITVDGETLRREALIVAVANGSQYGNNARIAPLASVRDGVLDLVIVGRQSVTDVPFGLARLFGGTMHRGRNVEMRQARAITIRRDAEGAAHLDGEPVAMPAELQVHVVPLSLRIVVPDAAGAI